KKRAVEIRILAVQESVGLIDEVLDCSEFLPGIAKSRHFLDVADFVCVWSDPLAAIPKVPDAVGAPTAPPPPVGGFSFMGLENTEGLTLARLGRSEVCRRNIFAQSIPHKLDTRHCGFLRHLFGHLHFLFWFHRARR